MANMPGLKPTEKNASLISRGVYVNELPCAEVICASRSFGSPLPPASLLTIRCQIRDVELMPNSVLVTMARAPGGAGPIQVSPAMLDSSRHMDLTNALNMNFAAIDSAMSQSNARISKLEEGIRAIDMDTDTKLAQAARLNEAKIIEMMTAAAAETGAFASIVDAALQNLEARAGQALQVQQQAFERDIRILAEGMVAGYVDLRSRQKETADGQAAAQEVFADAGAASPPMPVPDGAPAALGPPAAQSFSISTPRAGGSDPWWQGLQQQQRQQQQPPQEQQPQPQPQQQREAEIRDLEQRLAALRAPPPDAAYVPGAPSGQRFAAPLPQPFALEWRRWDKKVDPTLEPTKPTSYATWHLKAVRWLDGGHATVAQLLQSVLLETAPLTPAKEEELAAKANVRHNLSEINRAIADGICETADSGVRRLSEALGRDRGLELYRHLHVQAKGLSPTLIQGMVDQFLRPHRCTSMVQLKDSLVTMRQLIRDLELQGHTFREPDLLMGLKGLLPQKELDAIEDLEFTGTLRDYESILTFIDRKVAQAHLRHVSEGNKRLNRVETEQNPQQHNPVDQDDVSDELTAALEYALNALGKAKGKGRGSKVGGGKGDKNGKGQGGKNGKGQGTGGGGGGAGGGGEGPPTSIAKNFTKGCWHCGAPGHTRSECRKFSAEMAKRKGLREVIEDDTNNQDETSRWYLGQLESEDDGKAVFALRRANRFSVLSEEEEEDEDVGVCGASDSACFCANLDTDGACEEKGAKTDSLDKMRVKNEGRTKSSDKNGIANLTVRKEENKDTDTSLLQSGLQPYHKVSDKQLEHESWMQTAAARRRIKNEQRMKSKRARFCDAFDCARCGPVPCSHAGAGLGLLQRDDEQPLVSEVVAPEPRSEAFVTIRALVDSGAEDTVAPPGALPGTMVPSAMSKAGRKYRAANGAPIDNIGQIMALFQDARGRECGMPFQVAAVERPLISVTQLADAGHEVFFGKQGGTIRHTASGRTIPLKREKGVYVLEMKVPKSKLMESVPSAAASAGAKGPEIAASGFTRPAR